MHCAIGYFELIRALAPFISRKPLFCRDERSEPIIYITPRGPSAGDDNVHCLRVPSTSFPLIREWTENNIARKESPLADIVRVRYILSRCMLIEFLHSAH